MKTTFTWVLTALLTGLSLPSGASADPTGSQTLLACKKRHPWVYSSYSWVVIEKLEDESLSFSYGNGIDTGMIEIQFQSPITQLSPTAYKEVGADYELTASVDAKNKLGFVIRTSARKVTEKGYACD